MIFSFLGDPSGADAEDQAPVGEPIKGREFLGQYDQIMLGDQGHAGPQFNCPGHGRRASQRYQRIHHMVEIAGEFAAGGVWRAAGGWNVSMLGQKEGLEAAFFSRHRELWHANGFVGGKNRYSVFHRDFLFLLSDSNSPCRPNGLPRQGSNLKARII